MANAAASSRPCLLIWSRSVSVSTERPPANEPRGPGRFQRQRVVGAVAGPMPVMALLVAPPGAAPTIAKGDMTDWAKQQQAATAADRDQTQELLRNGVDDPEFRTFYQSEVARLNRVLAGINPAGPVVFGIVVRGPASDLLAISQRPGIRLVDVGASAKTTDATEYRGVRPEQLTTVDQNAPRPF